MAEIGVERRGPGVWPWILGLVVLALLVWGLLAFFDREPEVEPAVIAQPADG